MAEIGQNLQAALKLVCDAFRFFGVTYVSEEHLRLAKRNEPAVCPVLWKLVADLIVLRLVAKSGRLLAFSPPHNTAPSFGPRRQEVVRVLVLLLALRYPRLDAVAQDPLKNSRELLLVVGFLLDTAGVLDAFRRRHHRPRAILPPYPADTSELRLFFDAARHEGSSLRTKAESCPASAQALSHIVLQIHSRWRSESKAVEELEVHRLQELRLLRAASRDLHEGRSPSQYEFYVLEKPELYRDHLVALSDETDTLLTYHLERLFWKWMASAAREPAAFLSGKTSRTNGSDGFSCAPGRCLRMSRADSLARFDQAVSLIRLTLSQGCFRDDVAWHWLQDRYDETGQRGFLAFVKNMFEDHKHKLEPSTARLTKARLVTLGKAFDEVLCSPWRNGCVLSPEDSERVLQKLRDMSSLFSETVAEAESSTDHSPTLTQVEAQRLLQVIRSRYNSALAKGEEVRWRSWSDIDECVALAARCGLTVLSVRPRNVRNDPKERIALLSTSAGRESELACTDVAA